MADTKEQERLWVIEVESGLEGEREEDVSTDGQEEALPGLIHKVPKSLFSKNTRMLYHPSVLFMGPYHFHMMQNPEGRTEFLKSEVTRFVHHKIKDGGHRSCNQAEIRETEEGYIKNKSGIKFVKESFKKDEVKIRSRYSNKDLFNVSGDVCAWMMARDACFVIHVLERFRDDEDEHKIVSAMVHRFLTRKHYNPVLTKIVQDLFKMENQLPFWTLQAIRPDIGEWLDSALKNLSPIKVADAVEDRLYACNNISESHILQLLHDYIVDRQEKRDPVHYYPALVFNGIKHVITQWLTIRKTRKIRKRVPTVEELQIVGIQFERLKGPKKGISHIKFKKRNSTLYLPQFEVDHTSEVILRNLIALEICSNRKEKPITSYVIFMHGLIENSGDVRILKQDEIMSSKLGSDKKTSEFCNSMKISTVVPRYDPIDKAVSSIYEHRENQGKVYWAQFLMIYCSKPWLVVSLLAGIMLLLFTFLQVVCLFVSCQIK